MKETARTLREALKSRLSGKELSLLVTSFDVIGSIAVIEIPKELEKKAKIIGYTLLKMHKNLKTVAMIKGAHKGKFRVQPLKIVAGKKNFNTIYKESGCVFKVKVNKVFFSPRLSFERLRIAKLIKPNEVVGAFFAGVGPYPIIFARHSQMKQALAIELNPIAFKLLKENIALNKMQDKIIPVKGDVSKIVPKHYPNFFDRIVMPLPEGSKHFLNEAFTSVKDKGIIHFYAFTSRMQPFSEALNLIKNTAKKFNKKVKILNKRQVRSFSASKVQVVIDFQVLRKRLP